VQTLQTAIAFGRLRQAGTHRCGSLVSVSDQ